MRHLPQQAFIDHQTILVYFLIFGIKKSDILVGLLIKLDYTCKCNTIKALHLTVYSKFGIKELRSRIKIPISCMITLTFLSGLVHVSQNGIDETPLPSYMR